MRKNAFFRENVVFLPFEKNWKSFRPMLTYAEDRKKNAQFFEEAFYGKKDLDPQLHVQKEERKAAVPEGIDPDVLAKVVANPETAALLACLAKSMGGQED